MSVSLMQRADRLLASGALAALAAVPLASQADTLPSSDLEVTDSGVYFYNSSGYFAPWSGVPDGATVDAVNPDGSTKLYGSASADPSQFLGHNCSTEWGCTWYEDRGVTLVWRGTLRAPAGVGDRLSMAYDFTIDAPDTGVSWILRAQLGSWDFAQSNSLGGNGAYLQGELAEGSHQLQGRLEGDELQSWEVSPDSPVVYWQVSLSAVAYAPWAETYWSDTYHGWVTPFRGLSITVPDQSLDVALVPFTPAVPEPASALMALLGLGTLLARRRRAD